MSTFDLYVGVDWGTARHQVCIVDPQGSVLGERSIEHSGEAIGEFSGSWRNWQRARSSGSPYPSKSPRTAR
jgi:hypothetical protein